MNPFKGDDGWRWRERFIGSLVGVAVFHLIIMPILVHVFHLPPPFPW